MIEATLASWIDSLVYSPFATAVASNAIIAAAIALVAQEYTGTRHPVSAEGGLARDISWDSLWELTIRGLL